VWIVAVGGIVSTIVAVPAMFIDLFAVGAAAS